MSVKTRNVAVSTIVLAYSMFGIVGFVSSMISPTPIVRAISSGLTIFSYSCIAVLSKRMSFRELFHTLMPLNIINIVKTYAETGYMMIKYQSIFGKYIEWTNEYIWASFDAISNNETLTNDYLNKTISPESIKFVDKIHKIQNTSSVWAHPYITKANDFVMGIPLWLLIVILSFVTIWVCVDLVIVFIQNAFTVITYPIVYLLTAFTIIYFRSNVAYLYLIPQLWIPLAATVDSFIRIYLLRALFFRFFKNHPLISSYAKGGIPT